MHGRSMLGAGHLDNSISIAIEVIDNLCCTRSHLAVRVEEDSKEMFIP